MLAAALHAIESAGLEPTVEQQVAEGVYGWINEQPEATRRALLEALEEKTDAFALASADDIDMTGSKPGDHSEIDLEFFDQLLTLGGEAESRQRACLRLSTVLPRHLWAANQSAALDTLRKAELLRAHRDA